MFWPISSSAKEPKSFVKVYVNRCWRLPARHLAARDSEGFVEGAIGTLLKHQRPRPPPLRLAIVKSPFGASARAGFGLCL
jgi:hypothetical protein